MGTRKLWLMMALALALQLATAGPAAAQTLHLLGNIGAHSVAASLERQGERLTGWYFYLSQARQIRLEGKIDSQGAFSLEESGDGKVTGYFGGQARDGRWSGAWRKDAQAAPLALEMEESRGQLAGLSGDFNCRVQRRDARFGYTYHWELKLVARAGKVTKLASTQGSKGDDGDERNCYLTSKDLKQISSSSGLLLRFQEDQAGDDDGDEGQGCYVRIVGNDDLLWVIIGSGSGLGGDCRSLTANMLCSPHAFWNDLVIDRRGQKCRPVR